MQFFVYRVGYVGRTLRVPDVDEGSIYDSGKHLELRLLIRSIGLCRFILSFIALRIFGFVAITLGKIIVSKERLNSAMIQHEFVHVIQWLHFRWRFPLIYICSFLCNFLFGKRGVRFSFLNAYRAIRFEREAYEGALLSPSDFLSWLHSRLKVKETIVIKI
jgi:hypothetical protein